MFISKRDKDAIWAHVHWVTKLACRLCIISSWLTVSAVCIAAYMFFDGSDGTLKVAVVAMILTIWLGIANAPGFLCGAIRALSQPDDRLARKIAWQSLFNASIGPLMLMVTAKGSLALLVKAPWSPVVVLVVLLWFGWFVFVRINRELDDTIR